MFEDDNVGMERRKREIIRGMCATIVPKTKDISARGFRMVLTFATTAASRQLEDLNPFMLRKAIEIELKKIFQLCYNSDHRRPTIDDLLR
jgi:hypothetical protein